MTAVELPVLPDLGLPAEVELPVMPEQLDEQALLDFPELPAAWKAPGLPELPGSGTLQELPDLLGWPGLGSPGLPGQMNFLELLALKLPAAWKAPGLPELPGSGPLQELDELPPPFPAF